MKHSSHDFAELSPHYINRMRNMPILSQDEEYQLAKKWSEDRDSHAMSTLIESHLRLISKIASGYKGYGLPLSDLISEGNVGMMQAMRHFDPDKGFRLSTYAMWWIKAAIQDYIIRTWSLVRMGTTAGQKKLFFNLRREKKLIDEDNSGLTPDMISHIAQKLDVRDDEVIQMYYRLSGTDHSLNATYGSSEEAGSTSEWIDWLVDDRENQETQAIESDEVTKRKILFDKAMEHLNERERQIIIDRRLKDPAETLEVVAKKMGISRERVRQIEVQAFDKLQRSIKRLSNPHFHNI